MSKLRERAAEANPAMLFMDGFDEALVGVVERCGQPTLACYDRELCIGVLVKDGMTYEEANAYFDFNCTGAWVGEQTPVVLTRVTEET